MKADEIKAIREKAGISQKTLAARLGLSRRTIEGWEQGLRSPNEENERKIKALKGKKEAKS